MRSDTCHIECRRGDHEFQLGPAGDELFQVTEQEINVQAAFVRFVDDERVVLVQPAVALDFRQQDPVRHHLDAVVLAELLVEAGLKPDDVTGFRAQFLGNAAGNGARGETTRLCMADQTVHTAPERQADFRDLGGFARAGFAAHDHHRVARDCRGDLLPSRDHGQLVRERERRGFLDVPAPAFDGGVDRTFERDHRLAFIADPTQPATQAVTVPTLGAGDFLLQFGGGGHDVIVQDGHVMFKASCDK